MREKLQIFVNQKNDHTAVSSFWERFRFFKTERSRNKHLKRLRDYNRDMDLFVQRACKAAERKSAASRLRQHPSSKLRALSRRVFLTLCKFWTCQCTSLHQARFSLDSCSQLLSETQLRESGLYFDFLVSRLHMHGRHNWLEAKVTIKPSQ
jgi:hypothetical protein